MTEVADLSVVLTADVTQFIADMDRAMAKATQVDAVLANLTKAVALPTVELRGADSALAKVAELRVSLGALGRMVAHPSVVMASTRALPLAVERIDALTVALKALGDAGNVDVGVKGLLPSQPGIGLTGADAALTKITEVQAALDALGSTVARPGIDVGGGLGTVGTAVGGAGFLAGLLGGAASGGGGGGGGGSLLGGLGFGGKGGGILGIGAGAATFGSIGSILGLGVEHLIATMLGVGGSAIGGMIGGGLLGAGALGVGAVGMGTDMAGMGQALKDIKSVTQAQDALSQAVAVYGKNSIQAAAAQGQLNYTLGTFAPIARGAIVAAANTAEAFHTAFVAVTGEAVKLGAEILNQAMKVGMAFLPTIGKYAAQNLGIIQKDLQPLFAWLDNPGKSGGLGIFTDLEKIFQGQLPTAVHALTQGFELLAKTIDVAAHYTGGFLRAIDKFLTRENTTGFDAWSREIGKLIGLFHTWLSFMIAVGRTIVDLFLPAAGAGQALIGVFTVLLDQIDKWLTAANTKSALHNLFSAHLKELISGVGGALEAALPFILSFAGAFIRILAVGAQLGALLIAPVAAFLRLVDKAPIVGTVVGWAVAFRILIGAIRAGLIPLLVAMGTQITLLPTRIGLMALSMKEFASSALTELTLLPTRIGLLALSLKELAVSGFAALSEQIALLPTRIGLMALAVQGFAASVGRAVLAGAVWIGEQAVMLPGLLAQAAAWTADAVAATAAFVAENAASLGIAAAILALTTAVLYMATHWRQTWNFIRTSALATWKFLDTVWHGIYADAMAVWNPLLGFFRKWWPLLLTIVTLGLDLVVAEIVRHWHDVTAITDAAWGAIERSVVNAWHLIYAAVAPLVRAVVAFIHSEWLALVAITSAVWSALLGSVEGIWRAILAVATTLWSLIYNAIVHPVVLMLQALTGLFGHTKDVVGSSLKDALSIALSIAGQFFSVGQAIVMGIVHGVEDLAGAIGNAVSNAANNALSAVKGILGIKSPSTVFAEQVGMPIAQGIAQGILSSRGLISGALFGATSPSALGFSGASAGMVSNVNTVNMPVSHYHTWTGSAAPSVDTMAAVDAKIAASHTELVTRIKSVMGAS